MAEMIQSTLPSFSLQMILRRLQPRNLSSCLIAVLCIFLVVTYLPADASTLSEGTQPHIVGGQDAAHGEYPWQAMITDANYTPFCGGSLLTVKWVVTAAHCVQGISTTTLQRIRVVLGAHEYNHADEVGRQIMRIARVIQHPDFVPSTFDNDVALIELSEPAAQTPWVHTIDRVHQGVDNALWQAGREAIVTGWGFTSESGGAPTVLQEVALPIAQEADCVAVLGTAITANMLCAGAIEGGQDACRGDSGGPLIVADGVGTFHLVALVSWGNGCARPNRFGVYTKLVRYEAWIDSYIHSDLQATPLKLDLIANDGFENGPDHSWQENSPFALELIVNYGPVLAASGQHLAWLGGTSDQRDRIWQTVTFPQGVPVFLNYQYQIRSDDPICGSDQATLIIGQWRYKTYHLCQETTTSSWQSAAVKLDVFGGQQAIIKYLLTNDSLHPSSFFLDNVQLSLGRPLHPKIVWSEAAEAFDPIEGRDAVIVPLRTFLPLLAR